MNLITANPRQMHFKEVKINSLDNFVQERQIGKIDFIKLDVEGFEYEVLAGGQQSIVRSKPVIFLELDDNNLRENNRTAKDIIELLISFGYSTFQRADNLELIKDDNHFAGCHYDIIVS